MFTFLLYLIVGSLAVLLVRAALAGTARMAVVIGNVLTGLSKWWRERFGVVVKAMSNRSAWKDRQHLSSGVSPVQVGPDPIVSISRNLGNGREATVILRARPEKKLVTVQLIVWASKPGKTRRSKSKRVETFCVELGALPASRITENEVSIAMGMAEAKLLEPGLSGVPTADKAEASAAIETPQGAEVVGKQMTTSPDLQVAEAALPTTQAGAKEAGVKLKRYPSLYRGVVLELGMMPKETEDEGTVQLYGVKVRTDCDAEDIAWGSDLKRAFSDARAGPGDYVEIVKVGRRLMQPGRAPKNLYRVQKVDRPPSSQ